MYQKNAAQFVGKAVSRGALLVVFAALPLAAEQPKGGVPLSLFGATVQALAKNHDIAVERDSLATSARGIYAGGDVAFGPRNLIDAIGDGRRAAASIHRLLSGEAPPRPRFRRMLPVTVVDRPVLGYDAIPRVEIPSIPSQRRVGSPEIELGYTEDQARREAARCLQCFLNIELEPRLCILCGGCVDICPEKCIRIVPVEEIVGISVPGPSSALILQEDFCIRCGLCVERCPTNALSLDGWSESSTGLREIEPVAS